MTEWAQAFGQLTGVVVGGVIAGTVAIVVGSRNNRANDARLERQFRAEQERESYRVLRDRREELYVLTGEWIRHLQLYSFLGLRLTFGKITYAEYLDQQLDLSKDKNLQIPRMDMLREVYGSPDITAAYRVLIDARDNFNHQIGHIEKLSKTSAMGSALIEHRNTIDTLCSAINDSGQAFLERIAASVTNRDPADLVDLQRDCSKIA